MAAPLTLWTSYVAGTTPYVKADDLVAWQRSLNGIFDGTIYMRSLRIDGTGGTGYNGTGAPTGSSRAGTLRVSALDSSAATPTTTVAQGELSRSLVPLGWAAVTATGVFDRGVNVFSCTRTVDPGQYRVVLNIGATTDYTSTHVSLTVRSLTLSFFGCATTQNDGANRLQVDIRIWDTAGNAQNGAFSLAVFGE